MPQLNQNLQVEIPIFDFSGGQASAKADLARGLNEFKLVNNLIILAGGAGLRNKPGNTAFNASAMNSGAAIQGLGYLNIVGTGNFLVAVAGGKIYRSTIAGASFSDITGAVTVTTGADNTVQFVQFNNKMIGVGGAPNAPFTVTNTGNAALLGGTPPTTGTFGFSHANRMFIGTTDTLYYSVLSNEADWTSAGSGSATFELGDGSKLVTGVELDINNCLIFKEDSIHIMTGRSDPFPTFKLFDGIGCAGKHAAVVADGMCYFITRDGYLAITDGQTLYDVKKLPALKNVADEFAAVPVGRLPYICGVRHRGDDFDWIIWTINKNNANGTNDYAVIWDLNNSCFITAISGFEANCFARSSSGTLYMGGYAGVVYQGLVEGTYTEASNAGANVTWLLRSGALAGVDVAWFLRSGSLSQKKLSSIFQIVNMNVAVQVASSAIIQLNYGYNSFGAANTASASVTASGGLWGDNWGFLWSGIHPAFLNFRLLGRGNYFRYELTGSSAVNTQIVGLTLRGRQQGIKDFGVS